jgi:NAD(P)H dehydrogenase (quinone)
MYAITGVTGKVGGSAARALLAARQPVRAVLRDSSKAGPWRELGCEVAYAEMEDADALAEAFAGTKAAFILPPSCFDPQPGFPEAKAVIDAVDAALRRANPARVVCLSTVGAQASQQNLLTQRTLIEERLRKLPMPVGFLRPAWFLDNIAWDIAPAREQGLLHGFLQPLDRPVPMVATGDVGRVAAEMLQQEWTGARIVEVEGPERITQLRIAQELETALKRPVRVEAVPRESWDSLFRAQGMRDPGPRIRMLDGFNEGWITFEGTQGAVKRGSIGIADVVAALAMSSEQR